MEISRQLQKEFDKRDEMILALEMLTVDQACRLMALEAIVLSTDKSGKISKKNVNSRITAAAERFHTHFEAASVEGFVERAHRIANEIIAARKA